MTLLDVWVPEGLRHNTIARGSAIVSNASEFGSLVVVYYEGNLYDAINLRQYRERLRQAAGRLVTGYPTSAKMALPTSSLLRIGQYGYEEDRLWLFGSRYENALAEWIAPEVLPGDEQNA